MSLDLNTKIAEGLGRISEVFKVLLWDYAKQLKLSPIQIQILNTLYVLQTNNHKKYLREAVKNYKNFNLTNFAGSM